MIRETADILKSVQMTMLAESNDVISKVQQLKTDPVTDQSIGKTAFAEVRRYLEWLKLQCGEPDK